MVLVARAQNIFLNEYALSFRGTRYLRFGRFIYLLSYFVSASSEGSGEAVHKHSLARAFADRICDEYRYPTCWFNCVISGWL